MKIVVLTRWNKTKEVSPLNVSGLTPHDLNENELKMVLIPETSNVPPPRSNTRIVSLFFYSNPYASEAAVGSFMIRSTSRPAIRPASLVAVLWESLK